jgi:UDP-N-acetylglucosamine 2-epimerase (non-hydrolysing)
MLKIMVVAGARPNFVKVAPIMDELEKYPSVFNAFLVHTGQHYGKTMSDTFFEDLRIRQPDVFLGVGSGSHASQTAEIMKRVESVLVETDPDFVLVVGDVNSTLACALTAAKLQVKVIHVEAGLRSQDRSMPEEINRVLTDHLSDLLFVSEESGYSNLLREGIDSQRVHFVGNVMIDSLRNHIEVADSRDGLRKLVRQDYGIVTLHRPSNVDDPEVFAGILSALARIAKRLTLLFPMHPRTESQVRVQGLARFFDGEARDLDGTERSGIYHSGPLRYSEFLGLIKDARVVFTDSGGIQEETTALGVRCVTLRNNTERPSTLEFGTNRLAGTDPERIVQTAFQSLSEPMPLQRLPPLWDGHAARRIVEVLLKEARPVISVACSGK